MHDDESVDKEHRHGSEQKKDVAERREKKSKPRSNEVKHH